MSENVKRGRGRPKKTEDGYLNRVELRMNDSDMDMLDQLESETGCSRSEIIRAAVHSYYSFFEEVNKNGRKS